MEIHGNLWTYKRTCLKWMTFSSTPGVRHPVPLSPGQALHTLQHCAQPRATNLQSWDPDILQQRKREREIYIYIIFIYIYTKHYKRERVEAPICVDNTFWASKMAPAQLWIPFSGRQQTSFRSLELQSYYPLVMSTE